MKKKSAGSGVVVVPVEVVEQRIRVIRGQKALLDSDLADMYGVTTSNLNLAVRRNLERFPKDFMFQLTATELESLRLQNAMSKGEKAARGGRRYLPYAFTQEGVAMLSSVLNSTRAIQVNIAIMRVFVKIREVLAANQDLAAKIEALEKRYEEHDEEIQTIFDAIRQLLEPPVNPGKRQIGFLTTSAGGD
ncbi:MAG: ORF6N domain-containing protein [Acidobacteria bacterium]|nr:ORF6N domain-containing protein [Acidobacteriota bacterium]